MTSGGVRRAAPSAGGAGTPAASFPADRVIGTGRPPWWSVGLGVVVTAVVSVELLTGDLLGRWDQRVSDLVGGVRDSWAYWPIWVFTQAGGRGFILAVLAVLAGWLGWRRRTVLPALRILLALVLLTAVVYAFKEGMGRTAPRYPGSFFHREGASFPSGHVANAVLMWGVARWQAVEFGLPVRVQQLLAGLSVVGPVAAGVAMVLLDFHWVTDAVVGAAVGLVLLGVVHALDPLLLARWGCGRADSPAA